MLQCDITHYTIMWTRKFFSSFDNLLKYITHVAEDIEDAEAIRFCTLARARFIDTLKKNRWEVGEARRMRRIELDMVRIANLPSIEQQNTIAHTAFLDMHIIYEAYIGEFEKNGEIPDIVRRLLNAQSYGISTVRTFPGRPGEWDRMKLATILKCLSDPNQWFILVVDHKTFKSMGPLGRFMPKRHENSVHVALIVCGVNVPLPVSAITRRRKKRILRKRAVCTD